MIDYLRGRIARAEPALLVVECNGVGYAVRVSLNTYSAMKDKAEALVHIYFQVREDAHILYGFAHPEERALFEQLISISGVGGNTALTMLSRLTAEELHRAIASGDLQLLKSIKGIGEKTAQRILLELRGKLGELPTVAGGFVPTVPIAEEASKALVALGFPKVEADKRIAALMKNDAGLDLEALIKGALRG
jgi:holliday junction DNA helicase RuvA